MCPAPVRVDPQATPEQAAQRRPARPQRPPVPQLPLFDVLDGTHKAALEMLDTLAQLVARLEGGVDDQARQQAAAIMGFFAGPARDHHHQEETQVFPGLLASGDPALTQHVHRLRQDHGWIEEDWRELAPHVESIAQGYAWYDLAMLRLAVPVFTSLYQEHIALEESLIFPAARRQLVDRLNGERERTAGS